jgi:integrase/recombinase XerD
MKVQRARLSNHSTWLVLDDEYRPIQPILTYLKFLDNLDRSPNTIRAVAQHLKAFWLFLREHHIDWTEVDVVHLAEFITWLRQSDPAVASIEPRPAQRTNATIDQMLSSVHGFYDFHMRLKTVAEIPLYRLLLTPNRRYKHFLYGIAKTKPVRTRVVSVSREKRQVKTLTEEQLKKVLSACTHTRDRFLFTLLYSTGMRIGQALGLRHEDINVEDGEISIVPRENNVNEARAKTRDGYVIPGLTDLMRLYTDYLIEDLGALETPSLPDYVFVNLWEGEIGRPMTYAAVRSLVKRLSKKTGVRFTPHMLRHSRATNWIREDKHSTEIVSRLLGHADLETTDQIYVTLTAQDLKRVLIEGQERKHEH